jgi:membrane protein implicated in regulation of membrane protease activity
MEIFGITFGWAIMWIALAIIFIIIEVMTLGLATIWFAGGAVAAAVSTMFTSSLLIQVIIFLVVSVVLLYFTKSLRKKLKIGKEKTNVDALIGKSGFVMETISPAAFGQVKVEGIIWTAMSKEHETVIEAGTEISVVGVEGVKLIVAPIYNKNI